MFLCVRSTASVAGVVWGGYIVGAFGPPRGYIVIIFQPSQFLAGFPLLSLTLWLCLHPSSSGASLADPTEVEDVVGLGREALSPCLLSMPLTFDIVDLISIQTIVSGMACDGTGSVGTEQWSDGRGEMKRAGVQVSRGWLFLPRCVRNGTS